MPVLYRGSAVPKGKIRDPWTKTRRTCHTKTGPRELVFFIVTTLE